MKIKMIILGVLSIFLIIAGLILFTTYLKPLPNTKLSNNLSKGIDSQKITVLPASIQLYNQATDLFMNSEYLKAKPLCIDLLNKFPDENLKWGDQHFKMGPLVLYMLGRISIQEKKYDTAIQYFQQMVDKYGDEYIIGLNEHGDQGVHFEGLSGGEGIINQIEVMYEYNEDYESGYKLAIQLKNKYGKSISKGYEWSASYEAFAARYILEYLEKTKAPLEKWDQEVRKFSNGTNDNEIAGSLLLKLGNQYQTQNNDAKAIEIYNEVIKKYRLFVYMVYVSYRSHGIDAYIELIKIYQKQNNTEMVEKTKNELKLLYNDLLKTVKEEQKHDFEFHIKSQINEYLE